MSEDKRTIGWINWNSDLKKKKVSETLEITLNLFLAKKTINEIANIRKFKIESVERQIIELITKSKINVDDVIGKKKREMIFSNINYDNITKLSEIKANLGENANWFEIKCVLAHINSNK